MTISAEVKELDVILGNLISSTPTTLSSTGWRAYAGKREGQSVLVMHWEGTPANASLTKVFDRHEALDCFSWEIGKALVGHCPEFYSVAKFIESM